MEISLEDLGDLSLGVLLRNGMSRDDSETIVEHLMCAEICGKTPHGVVKIPRLIRSWKSSSPKPISVVRETPVSVLLDGGQQIGLVVAERAMQEATRKARSSGIGLAGGFNCDGTGMIGYYARKALSEDFIGIAMANSPASVAPHGSGMPLLGTNPIAIAIPAREDFILTDISTAKMTIAEILLAGKLGGVLPDGVLLDDNGQPSHSPDDLAGGAILPIATYKGSALAFAIEALAGPLVAAKAGWKAVQGSSGFLVGAINPEIFVPIAKFKQDVQALIDEARALRPAGGVSAVLIPGERSEKTRVSNLKKGSVSVPDAVITELCELLTH